MDSEIKIRKAEQTDISNIAELNKELFIYEKEFSSVFDEDWVTSEQAKNHYKDRITYGIVFLAENKNNDIIGMIFGKAWKNFFARHNPNLAELEILYVKEEYRSLGIGKKLYEAFKKEVRRKNGKSTIKVNTHIANINTITFYRSLGFNDFGLTLEASVD